MYQCMHIMHLLKPGEPGLSPGPLPKKTYPFEMRFLVRPLQYLGNDRGRCQATSSKKSLLMTIFDNHVKRFKFQMFSDNNFLSVTCSHRMSFSQSIFQKYLH